MTHRIAILFGVLSSLLPAWAGAAQTDGVYLVKDGKALCTIVVPEKGGAAIEEIAAYFSKTVEQATGAKIPIIRENAAKALSENKVKILVGVDQSHARELPEEAYRLTSAGNEVIISGRDGSENVGLTRSKPVSMPTLWAMNRILEQGLGVRWLWPGELGTFVPKREDLFVPFQDVTYQPPLIQRKLRIIFNFAVAGRGNPTERRLEREAFDWVEHHQAGRRGDFKFGHAFSNWWEKFSATHPDYFMVPPDGVDLAKIPPQYIKLRLSNPAVIEEIARQYTAAGAPKYWNVCPNDGSGFDTSEGTRAWDIPLGQSAADIWGGKANLTARYVMFWNLLGERLQRINPDVVLCTYAYSSYRMPPPIERPVTTKLMVGVVLSFYDDALWKGWADSGVDLFLRPNWWHVGANAPYLPLAETERFIKMAAANGMIGIDMDSVMGYWATQGLNYYLVARLMNNRELTLEKVIDEYVSAFGRGGPKIREYFDYWQKVTTSYRYTAPDGKFQQLLAEGKVDKVLTRAGRHLLRYLYTDEVLKPAYKLLDEAETQVDSGDESARDRVAFLRSGLDEMKATRDLVALSVKIKAAPTEELKSQFKSQSDTLGRLRAQMSRGHAIWNEVISKDEDRRGVYYVPRFEAPNYEETDEM